MKQKIRTEKVNNQTADPKANASVFLFFPTAHFLKTILANRIPKAFGSTFGFTRHPDSNRDQPFIKPQTTTLTNINQPKEKTNFER